ncbi:monovalent cation/proton antiporter, MnhG/PhaG subunit [Myroides odoratimimus CCUG 12901]|uniref:monovalent cation/H(+) antiporter subunit G n=1 Tax=Myroides TaxID=76831 RepID=UPI00024604DC|nr:MULTISPECIES: monovalent cation/H(+) antiporter subunit G [Myroides]EHO05725.1 monovalent cation/proton antiporter, MnhG/PhaG subunit [Myroides odoratimimus CCUG 12901]MDM1496085.1 monovalent cation/H(+) antiporter subunit G [Myroides odoratimimus]MDM1506104.1 monovalent cation/H(+) antiporter subunit G [Myroides odoratimimus]MDM1516240.1 monovalent cation/H(+) antiporter subunit G [Myroides odoratimimus]
MIDIVIMILSTVGAVFVLIASIGIVRMPDFYTRLSITIKAATLGIGCILTAAAIHFAEFSTTTKVLAIIFFLFITSPVAAFLIARTAYITGIKLWDKSVVDELQNRYDNHNNIPLDACKEEKLIADKQSSDKE